MNATDETYENVVLTSVSIVAIQIALVDVLKSIGIRPDGIVGHSVGELGCSYADGAFTLEQTILAAYYRSKSIIDSNLEPGAMAAINLSWEEAKKICPPDISPVCDNSANSVTISGPSISLNKFAEELKSKGIFIRMIKCSGIAFHSKYIAPAESRLRVFLDRIITKPKQRSSKWISSSVPEVAWKSPLAQFCSTDYHVNNMLSPVLFREAIAHIPENAIIIDVAPHCQLQAILRRSLPPTVINVSLQKRNHSNNLVFLLSNVGKLYIAGAQPDISKLYPPVSFPVSRGTPMIGPLIKWDHSATWKVPDFKHKSKEWSGKYVVEIDLSRKTDTYLAGHIIDGRLIFPAAGFILMVWKMFAKLRDIDFEQMSVIFRNLWFQRVTFLPKKKTIKFLITIFEGNGDFEVREADAVVVSGNIRVAEAIEKDQLPPLSMPPTEFLMNTEDIYKELRLRGYEYIGIFKGLKSCDISVTVGELRWFNEWSSYMDNMSQFKILSSDRRLVYVSKIRYVAINPVLHKRLVNELPKDGGLPIYHYKNIDIVKSGGIEYGGLKFTTPQRQQIAIRPKYERYVFVPYENPRSLLLEEENPMNEKMHALTVLLQIVCENITTSRIKAVEIAGNRAANSLLAPLLLNILHAEPLVTIDLQVANSFACNYTSFNQMNDDANDTFSVQNVQLVIAAEVFSGQSCIVLKNLAAALSSNCFILLEETVTRPNLKTTLTEANLILVGKQMDSSGKSYLLLKTRRKKKEPIIIQISGEDFSWLENAKMTLKKFDSDGQEMLFISQGEELLGKITKEIIY